MPGFSRMPGRRAYFEASPSSGNRVQERLLEPFASKDDAPAHTTRGITQGTLNQIGMQNAGGILIACGFRKSAPVFNWAKTSFALSTSWAHSPLTKFLFRPS